MRVNGDCRIIRRISAIIVGMMNIVIVVVLLLLCCGGGHLESLYTFPITLSAGHQRVLIITRSLTLLSLIWPRARHMLIQ